VQRKIVFVSLLAITVLSIVSGPLVSGVSLTDRPSPSINPTNENGVPGTGNVSVSSVSVPIDQFILRDGNYGSESYYLIIPNATVDIESATGYPVINYKVRLHGVGTTYISSAFIGEDVRGLQTIDIRDKALTRETVTKSQYKIEVSLVARESSGFRTIYYERMTISVQ
jgi:hypothetical protein